MEILSVIYTELISKHENCFRVVFAKANLEVSIPIFHFSIGVTQRCLGKKIACPAASQPRTVIHVNTFQQRMWKDGEACGMSVGVCRVVRSTLKMPLHINHMWSYILNWPLKSHLAYICIFNWNQYFISFWSILTISEVAVACFHCHKLYIWLNIQNEKQQVQNT